MRYILINGYIDEVSFDNNIVCKEQNCVSYAGTTPTGYDSLKEWHEAQTSENKLNAWKIVDGNLVYDANKYEELQSKYDQEDEDNAISTHLWVKSQLGKSSSVVVDELSENVLGNQLVVLSGSGDYEIPKVTLSSETLTDCKVIASNKNLLGIDAVTTNVSGIDITINADGSIKLNGTSTATIEFILKGTSTNTDMLFFIKKDIDYTISGLTENVSLNLYNFDGTDRTLIDGCINETINLSSSYAVTQTTLNITNGATFSNVTIHPQIELSNTASEFIKHKESKAAAMFYDDKANIYDLYSYSPTTIVMCDNAVAISVDYFKYKALNDKFTELKVEEENISMRVTNASDDIETINSTLQTINSTILNQTEDQFEMLFERTNTQQTLDELQGLVDNQNTTLETMKAYIRYGTIDDNESEYYGSPYIELGKDDNQTKLMILDNRIRFMTGNVESAYISNNTLYITDSTILVKQQIGHWLTEEDSHGNLNTKWVSD